MHQVTEVQIQAAFRTAHKLARKTVFFSYFDQTDLQDLTIGALVTASQYFGATKSTAQFATYLYRCIRSALWQTLRSAGLLTCSPQAKRAFQTQYQIVPLDAFRPGVGGASPGSWADTVAASQDSYESLDWQLVLQTLPPKSAYVLRQYFFQQLSQADIANQLQCTEQNVYYHYNKGIKLLRAQFAVG